MDPFTVLADPTRRQILNELRRSSLSVNALVDALSTSQPTVSKHLRVLREAGFVSREGAAQQRIYHLESERFREIDAWLAPYRRLWTRHLDALERHLNQTEKRKR
jgi:DNA-binding transcriptional ArsR family regulator